MGVYFLPLRIENTNLDMNFLYIECNLKGETWHCLPFFCTEFVPSILGEKNKEKNITSTIQGQGRLKNMDVPMQLELFLQYEIDTD